MIRSTVPTLNYFPNIIHPIEEQPPLSFVVYRITHRNDAFSEPHTSATDSKVAKESSATSFDPSVLENGGPEPTPLRKRQSTFKKIQQTLSSSTPRPHIPTKTYSPLSVLSVASCLLTIGLLVWAFLIEDGTACVALVTISLASSIVGYASFWSPVLTKRVFDGRVPAGDVAIRTREGAFILVKCNENVARELYTGTEECNYYASTRIYRFLVGLGTFLLMVSVVLLGNCNFTSQ